MAFTLPLMWAVYGLSVHWQANNCQIWDIA